MKTATKTVTYEVETDDGLFRVTIKIKGVYDKGDYPHYPDTESRDYQVLSVMQVMPDGSECRAKPPVYSAIYYEVDKLSKDEELEYD